MSPHRFATHRQHSFPQRTAFLAILLVSLLILGAPRPGNAASDVYEVTNVAVDATAESAAAARESALAAGQREAFIRLLKRLTLMEHHEILPIPDEKTVSTYVRDFSVSDEKTSSVRYLANLHVRFKSDDVRALLYEFGLPFAETVSKPTVILPVMEYNGALMLWEEVNRWRTAWLQQPETSSLVPLLHPAGDLADIDTIGPHHAIDGDTQRLDRLSKRYGNAPVVVAYGVFKSGAFSDLMSLEVYVTRHDITMPLQTQVMTFSLPVGEPIETLLSNAALATATYLEEGWKQENVMRLGEQGVLPVSVSITGLQNWLSIQRKIVDIAVIRKMEMVLLSKDEVRLNLFYLGDVQQLITAFAQADLQLIQVEGVWSVTPL